MDKKQFTIKTAQAGQRLDIFCVSQLPEYSRATLQKAIRAGQITVNSQNSKPNHTLKDEDIVNISLSDPAPATEEVAPLKLEIIYEDKDIVAINKPAGVLVHGHAGSTQPTIADWLVEHYPSSQHVGEDRARPGIVHRLDKDTSGVLVMAKTPAAFDHLKEEFKRHRAKKEYLALVFGVPGSSNGRITKPIARSRKNPSRRRVVPDKPLPRGREATLRGAITEWEIEEKYGQYALLRLFPYTGRTHQLRVHLHHLGYPIVGDPLYTHKRLSLPFEASAKKGQLLHAEKLTIRLPSGSSRLSSSGKRKAITAPLPQDFDTVINSLKGHPASPPNHKPLSFRTPSDFTSRK